MTTQLTLPQVAALREQGIISIEVEPKQWLNLLQELAALEACTRAQASA